MYLLQDFHGHDLPCIVSCSLFYLKHLPVATLTQDLEQIKALRTHFLRCLVHSLRSELDRLKLLPA